MEQKTILVVEDSPNLSDLIKDIVEMREYRPIVTASGREAVSLALTEHPHLIILDIRLPDIDGYEVYRRIRENPWGAKASFLVLTASESIDEIAKNINLSTDRILFKPSWSVKDLLDKIDSLATN